MNLPRRPVPTLAYLQVLFFASGFSSLVLEVVSVKLLRYWVGNTAHAIAVVLCAFMAGLALGSFAGGKWVVRAKRPLLLYGSLELVVGLYSAGLPWLMQGLKPNYLELTFWLGPDTQLAHLGHFLTGATLLLIPTTLMGATFPFIVRAGSGGTSDRVEAAEKLYAVNVAGAALGTLLSDFLFVRFWGLGKTLILVAVVNSVIALWALLLQRARPVGEPQPEAALRAQTPSSRWGLVLAVALIGGFLVLFQELVWTHMVGEFLDNSVYGFAVALFAVIFGLGAGAIIVARHLVSESAARWLPWVCLGAGSCVILLIPFWDNARSLAVNHPQWSAFAAVMVLLGLGLVTVPGRRTLAFAAAALVLLAAAWWLLRLLDPAGAQFWFHHGVDFSVSTLFMIVPAVLMGMIFPLVLQWHLDSGGPSRKSVGIVYAVNTLGSVAGIGGAAFLFLPRLGVERSGRLAGLGLFLLGLLLLARPFRRRWVALLALIPALAWTLHFPAWDYSKTHTALGHVGKVTFAREDPNAGVTTVLQYVGTKQLYVNGLYEAGNDYEARDQARCALVPMLHLREVERAMVVGVGSGQTAGLVSLLPFKAIELVDFSPSVVLAARRFFGDINLGVFDDPRVRVHIADGRHHLMTHPDRLSMLTIEVSRLWVAGEGDLYTREFYELCASRLSKNGVLQQWVPLFQLSVPETLIILRTAREVFPYVALYMGEESGMLVASQLPLQVEFSRLKELEARPELAALLPRIGLPGIFSLLGDCVLTPQGLDGLLARSTETRISTDLWPHLEHSNASSYLRRNSSEPLRRFLLGAQEFQTFPVVGADAATVSIIQGAALEERRRLARVLRPQ